MNSTALAYHAQFTELNAHNFFEKAFAPGDVVTVTRIARLARSTF